MASMSAILKDAQKSLDIRKNGRTRTVTAEDGTTSEVQVPGRAVRLNEELEAALDMQKRANARVEAASAAKAKNDREIAEAEEIVRVFQNRANAATDPGAEGDAPADENPDVDDEPEADDETDADDEPDDEEADSAPVRVNGRFAKRS